MVDQVLLAPEHLGQLIRAVRLQRGLSQKEFARRLGITPPSLSQLEKNTANASLQRLMRVLAQLDLELVVRERADDAATGSEW